MENEQVNIGYNYKEIDGVGFYTAPSFDALGVLNCFTSRLGGVSPAPYDQLNLSFVRPEPYTKETLKNYDIICETLGISPSQLVLVNYCHGDGIEIVDESDLGNGLLFPNRLPPCDAIMTNRPGVALLTIHADCTSYIIFDPVNRVIAACHAGWKGTQLRIGAKTLLRMQEAFGSDPAQCIIGIGPNISFDKFEVDTPVADLFRAEYPEHPEIIKPGNNGKTLIDLTECAVIQFEEAGALRRNITVSGVCTYSDPERLFSFRRDGIRSGSMAEILMLRESETEEENE